PLLKAGGRRLTPNRTFVVSLSAVAASTVALPWIHGYGTLLFQIVVLGAWELLSKMTSQFYADRHHAPLWMIALVLNALLFAIPSTLIWALTRATWPRLSVYALMGWFIFYLASLFVLFPATDGP
ncbi:MAG: hypothetical protein ACRD3Q_22035, partial [Terriglobales bacterium]